MLMHLELVELSPCVSPNACGLGSALKSSAPLKSAWGILFVEMFYVCPSYPCSFTPTQGCEKSIPIPAMILFSLGSPY